MDAHWILAANAGRARIFRQPESAAPFEEVEDLVNAGARQRTADTETDDLGRRSSSTGRPGAGTPSQASGYEPHTTPAEHQTELFAKQLAVSLQRSHHEGRFRGLTLAASPEFLGVLRKAFDPELAKAIDLTIDKDYTHANASQLRDLIRKHRLPA